MSSNNPVCQKMSTPSESSGLPSVDNRSLDQDKSCIGADAMSRMGSPRHQSIGDGAPNVVQSQTRSETGVNPENPNSCTQAQSSPGDDSKGACFDEQQKLLASRNPITGLGLNGDGVGGWKPKKLKQREGNPVTGEGYTGPVNVPGVHPVINKNRVPPGGFSSGLW